MKKSLLTLALLYLGATISISGILIALVLIFNTYNTGVRELTKNSSAFIYILANTLSTDDALSLSETQKQRDIINHAANLSNLHFIRIADPKTRIIRLSSIKEEEGKATTNIPSPTQTVLTKHGLWNNKPMKEMSVWINDEVLWIGIDLIPLQKRALQYASQTFIILIIIGSAAIIIMYILLKALFIKPFNSTLKDLYQFGKTKKFTFLAQKTNPSLYEIRELHDALTTMMQEFKTMRQRDATISRLKSEFIAVAAHQLRTPLSVLKWSLKMLLDGNMGDLTNKQKEIMETDYQTNERMIKLINDLLDVARIEEGKFGYAFVLTDVIELIERDLKDHEIAIEQKHINFNFKKPIKPFPKIKVDPEKIILALNNLIDNALKYTPPQGSIEITASIYKRRYMLITITDTGIGISKEMISHLFDKFFRGDAAKLHTEGTGLGLFIIKNIIKRHGGDIWIKSKPNTGTTVYFTLPLQETLIPEQEETMERFLAKL